MAYSQSSTSREPAVDAEGVDEAPVEHNIALLRAAYGTFQDGDLEASAALLTDNFIANLPGLPEPLIGRDVWRYGAEVMRTGFPDLSVDVEDIFGAADKVAVRLRFRGAHRGPFEGAAPTGRAVEFTSIEIYRFDDGKIAEEWVSPDMMGLIHQIS